MARSGREVAARVLRRVAEEGAWAAPSLDGELVRANLPRADAARAADLVYGALRALPALDAELATALDRGGPIEPVARAALRVAAFELAHTDAPSHAVVSEAVALVKRERGEGLARFVNAVLRRLARARPATPRPRALALPPWVRAALVEGLGPERARALEAAGGEAPFLALRVATERTSREALAEAIAAARPTAEVALGAVSPRAVLVRGGGDPRGWPGYREGHFAVQDEGSQVIGLALGARPGEHVVDACSGRGGKSALLAAAVTATGRVTAIDLHPHKLAQIPDELARLGLADVPVESHAVDLSVGTGGLPEGSADRVLVDAPCTGLGTVRRRPELLLRLAPEDPARMAALALAIAARAASLVRPGGILAVATCSFAAEEGPALAAALEARVPGLERDVAPVLGLGPDPDGVLRLGPWGDPHGAMDGYQLMRFVRRA